MGYGVCVSPNHCLAGLADAKPSLRMGQPRGPAVLSGPAAPYGKTMAWRFSCIDQAYFVANHPRLALGFAGCAI